MKKFVTGLTIGLLMPQIINLADTIGQYINNTIAIKAAKQTKNYQDTVDEVGQLTPQIGFSIPSDDGYEKYDDEEGE